MEHSQQSSKQTAAVDTSVLKSHRKVIVDAGNLILEHCFILTKQARKNMHQQYTVLTYLEDGHNVWNTCLNPGLHYKKILPTLHILSLLRAALYNFFHGSVIQSILDESHDHELLVQIFN